MADASPSSILNAHALCVRYNERVVLDQASLVIHERDRLGIVGRNGSGKSTFLKIIAGQMSPDSGTLTGRRDLIVGYLPQDFALNESWTVEQNIRAGAGPLLDWMAEFESLPALSHRHEELEKRIHAHDGWGLDHRIPTAMSKLNCPAGDRSISSLSGGEQRRVALCRALISQPDLLILDEPTNHLDAESIEWLVGFLQGYPGALLVVTHDRYFLDEITRTILELSQGSFQAYDGNYTDYLLAKAEREASAELAEHKRQMFLRRELEWVRRGPSARRTKSRSRLDRYFEAAAQASTAIDRDMDLVLPPPDPLGNRIAKLTNVGMVLGGQRLFLGLDLNMEAGQRLGITGRNGLGKTTLLKILLGQVQPTEGTVAIGPLVQFNYVDQERLQLNEEATLLEQVGGGAESILFGGQRLSLRAYLKRFLFPDDRMTAQVKHLSGGERSRLLLAAILKNGGNFLILDEPTNDLDLPTLRVLEEALIDFPGVVVAVSHDRYFLNRICTDVLAFEGEGRVVHSVGDYDYYLEKRRRIEEAAAASARPEEPRNLKSTEAIPARPAAVKPRRLTFKERRELEGMEAAIHEAEEEVARLEQIFSDPDFHRQHGQRTGELTLELEAAREKVTTLYARWEELEAIRAASGPGPSD